MEGREDNGIKFGQFLRERRDSVAAATSDWKDIFSLR